MSSVTEFRDGFCPRCKVHVRARRIVPSYLRAFVLGVITCGVWWVVVLILLKYFPVFTRWICCACGTKGVIVMLKDGEVI